MNLPKRFTPKQVGIELVKGCNFSCQMCPVPLYREDSAWEFISLELLDQLVTEIEAHDSIETIWLVHFGEPLAHPKLRQCFEILQRVHAKFRRKVILHTNASLLKGEKVAALLEIPVVTDLTFSFDGFGDKASFEFLRGNHFDRVIENITLFAQEASLRRPDLTLSTCSVVPKAEELNGWTGEIPSADTVYQNFKQLFEPLNVTVHQRPMIDFSGNEVLPIQSLKPERVYGGCHFVEMDSLYFTVKGNAQPCCNVFNEAFNVGDIQTENFESLLNNSKMHEIRHLLRMDQRDDLPFCKNCSQSNSRHLSAEQLRDLWLARHAQYPLNETERQHIFGIIDPSALNDSQLLFKIWQQRLAPMELNPASAAPEGHLDNIRAANGQVLISGWAADIIDNSPLTEFEARVDGQLWPIENFNWTIRSDVAQSFNRPEWKFSGFELTLSALSTGSHQVSVQITNRSGRKLELLSSVSVKAH